MPLLAQQGTISGFVRDSTSHETLSYANVFVQGTGLGAVTNRDGYYVISGVEPGPLKVVASIIGYGLVEQEAVLAPGSNLYLEFELSRVVLAFEEVSISAQRQRFREAVEVSTVTLSGRDIEVAPAFAEADLMRTLQLLPGVQSVSDFSAALYVRGSTPDQNLILMDGITIYSPFHLGGIFSTFNTDAIKEAEFIAGGFSARHGGRMGSVIDIVNRDGNASGLSGRFNISLISAKGLIEGPLPKIGPLTGTYMLSGRRTYLDKIVDLALVAAGEPDEVGLPYHFSDYQAKVNLDFGSRHRITLSSFYGLDILAVEAESTDSYDRFDPGGDGVQESYTNRFALDWSWGNTANSIAWRWIPTPQMVTKFYLAGSRYRYGISVSDYNKSEALSGPDAGSYESSSQFDVYDLVEDLTIRMEASYLPSSKHTTLAGFEHKALHFNLAWLFSGSVTSTDTSFSYADTSLWIEYRPVEQAAYLEHRWRATARLALQLGLRVSRFSLHDRLNPEPRLGLKFFLREDLALTGAWGRYYQYLTTANPSDENLRIIDLWLPAPADRPAPYSEHTILGLEYLSDNNFQIKLEVYRKTFANLVYLKQGFIFFLGPDADTSPEQVLSEFLPAQAKSRGVELLLRKNQGKLKGWAGYSFSQTLWKTEEFDWYPPKYDRTHTFNLVGDWQLSKQWHFSTAYTFATGNPYTPLLGRYSGLGWVPYGPPNQDNYWFDTLFLAGAKHSARYPYYGRWDLSLVRSRPGRNGGRRQFYLQILNLLNRANVFQYYYQEKVDPRTDRSLGIERRVIPMFPIIPTIGWRYEF